MKKNDAIKSRLICGGIGFISALFLASIIFLITIVLNISMDANLFFLLMIIGGFLIGLIKGDTWEMI